MDKVALKRTKLCFDGNYERLIGFLDFSENPDHAIEHWNKEIHAELNELTRLLFNFLSSGKAFIDHSRKYIHSNYPDGEFRETYEQKKAEEISEDPLLRFVQDLRNFALHKELPVTGGEINLQRMDDRDGFEATAHLFLNKPKLMSNWDWNEDAKKYLQKAPEKILLKELCEKYHSRITNFFKWWHEEELQYLGYRKKEK